MKKIIYIIISTISIISCAARYEKNKVEAGAPITEVNDSLKEKYAVINDFLATKIKDRSKVVLIHSKKINTDMTLRILKLNEIYALDSIDKTKDYEDKTFYKEAEWEIARKKYSKNSASEIEKATFQGGECCWGAEIFNHKNIIFEPLEFGTPAYEKKYLFKPNDYEDFYFSEPLYYQNNEYLIFTFSHGIVSPTYNYGTNIVIYRKKNGKWVQTHIGMPNWFS